MPRVQITMRNTEEGKPLLGPELPQAECEQQAAHVQANITGHMECSTHPETGESIQIQHGPNATGVPDTVVDLGWAQLISGAIESVHIIDSVPQGA